MVGKNGWGVFDADVYEKDDPKYAANISLEIFTKDMHTDHTGFNHSATTSTLSDKANGRYILGCPQTAGEKTVKFVVTRPAEMTDFGGEWLKLFQKDSWINITNEYEPFTFNQYGAKIPLLRASGEVEGGGEDDEDSVPSETLEGSVTFYMVVADKGDYELMYGNPNLNTTYYDDYGTSTTRWVAVQFKKTLLRVGSPWADCTDDELATEGTYDVGTIIPAYFGHPNLNLQKYKDLATDLADTPVPVQVVLEIFDKDTKLYTMSEEDYSPKTTHPKGDYSKCYKSGNACPEGHSVCKSKFCEMDTWEEIIRLFQAIDGVKVLGAVGLETESSEYDILDDKVNGFFFKINATVEDVDGSLVHSLGEPLFNRSALNDVDTHVTLSTNDLGVWNPYSWYPHQPNHKWAAIVDEVTSEAMPDTVDTLFDRGYGWVFLTDEVGFNTSSSYNKELLAEIAKKYTGLGRRLSPERRLSEVTYSWGCDDTKYSCVPVCLAQDGAVTTITAESHCADVPVDMCSCKCYYDAQWACHKGEVVCKATKGVETMIVGDLLCESRGTPKPAFEVMSSNVRQAGQCEPVPTTRGEYPIDQCLDQWATTTTPEPEPEQESEEESSVVEQEAVEDATELALEVTASFAAAASVLFALTQ
jgi:hypothetical protein